MGETPANAPSSYTPSQADLDYRARQEALHPGLVAAPTKAQDPEWMVRLLAFARAMQAGDYAGSEEDIYRASAIPIQQSASAAYGARASQLASSGHAYSGAWDRLGQQTARGQATDLAKARSTAMQAIQSRKDKQRAAGAGIVGDVADWQQRMKGVEYSQQDRERLRAELERRYGSEFGGTEWDDLGRFITGG